MEFREMLERYKNGTAAPEERAEVERELDRARAVEEYLASDFCGEADELPGLDNEEVLTKVNKSMRRRTVKIIIAAVCIVLVGSILVGFFVTPAVEDMRNAKYLDPNVCTYDQLTTDFTLVMTAFTELHHPGYIMANAYAENIGIGKYNITLSRYDMNDHMELKYLTAQLDKGELTLPQEFHSSTMPVNIFVKGTYPFFDLITDEYMEEMKASLAELPDYIRVTAAVSFDEDITMEELVELMESESAQFIWAGIRNAPVDVQRLPLCGMELTGSGIIYDVVNEDYPSFELSGSQRRPEDFEAHFKSQLDFLIDHIEYLESFMPQSEGYYSDVRDYVEENGVMCYGCVVQGTGEELLALMEEQKNVIQMYITDAELRV